jgi:hypothetical protein
MQMRNRSEGVLSINTALATTFPHLPFSLVTSSPSTLTLTLHSNLNPPPLHVPRSTLTFPRYTFRS